MNTDVSKPEAPAPSTHDMSSWASNPAAVKGHRFFAKTPLFAAALREVFARFDQYMAGDPPLLPVVEPFLADQYELVWRSDRDLWKLRLFFLRPGHRLALELNHRYLTAVLQSDEADGRRIRSFFYEAGAFTQEPDCQALLVESDRLHALFTAKSLSKIKRFRFILTNMRVFDGLATCAKLGLLAERIPGFRFHTLELHSHRALVDPRSLPLGALFEGATLDLRGPRPPATPPTDEAPPEHLIYSTVYLYGGMRGNLRKGLDRLFPRPSPPGAADPTFTLAISLELEKRVWVEQVEALAGVLRLLQAHHPRVALMVNGMTSPALEPNRENFADIAEQERQAIGAMLAGLPGSIPVLHLHGHTILEKSEALARANYFIGPIGSASLLPLALGIPGLVYGSAEGVKAARWMIEPRDGIRIFPPRHVTSAPEAKGARRYSWARGFQSISYSMDPEVFVDFVARELARHGLLSVRSAIAAG
ncbi:MAG: hypothetical protein WCP77_03605 [Roseococcus sp.]